MGVLIIVILKSYIIRIDKNLAKISEFTVSPDLFSGSRIATLRL